MSFNAINRFFFINKVREIGTKVHEKFQVVIYESVFDEELKSLLAYLETHWFDSFRSSIIWYSSKIVGGDPEKTILPALIISLTGLGFGIHDDIIDKTTSKNKIDTAYGLAGQEKALVLGDLVISKGLTLMNLLQDEFDKETCDSIANIFTEYFSKMATGEIWEINANKNLDLTLDDYHDMLNSLGFDSETCIRLGAVCGKATVEQLDALSFFGSSMGYAYRLNEEIKDMLSLEKKLQMRIENESIPLALLYASKKSGSNYKKITMTLKKNEIDKNDIKILKRMFEEENVLEYIQQIIEGVRIRAFERMDIFPKSEARFFINCFESVIELP